MDIIKQNQLFVDKINNDKQLENRRDELVKGQHPKLLVITCSDSRVVPEFIFNATLGEIFVIRTAGNVINEGEHFASANLNASTSLIELGFETQAMGQYTLSFKANGNFNYMHLIDKLTGADVDMLAEGKYTFVGSSYDDTDRFIVKLNENAGLVAAGSNIFAWQNGSDIVVSGEGDLQVYDVMGRLVARQYVSGVETMCTSSVQTGVYIFRLNEKSQKIVIR